MVQGKKNLPSPGENPKWVDPDCDYLSEYEDEKSIREEYKAKDTILLGDVMKPALKPRKASKRKVAKVGQSLGSCDFGSRGLHKNKKIVVVDREDFEQFSVKNHEDILTIKKDCKNHEDILSIKEDSRATDGGTVQLTELGVTKTCGESNGFEGMTVSVTQGSIQMEALENAFGENYMEGSGTPRLFVIKVPSETSGYVVFHVQEDSNTQDAKSVCSSDDTNNVKVNLTLRCNISEQEGQMIQQKLTASFSHEALSTVQQFIDCIEKCLESFGSSDDTSYKKAWWNETKQNGAVKVKKSSSSSAQFSYLKDLNGWSVKAYDAEEALQVMAQESLNETKSNQPVSLPRAASASRSDIMCDICCDFIPNRGHMTGYALQSCDHWFCIKCWSAHLKSRILEGHKRLLCPSHQCDTEVDRATLIFLLPYSDFIRYESHVHSAKLEASREWKWCQGLQGNCEKIIRATAKKYWTKQLLQWHI